MASVAEALAARTELAGDLAAGVETLSLNQEVTFTQYTKVVLPIDGFVFWVRSDLLSPSALFNAAMFNAVTFNQAPAILTGAATLTAQGSLHHATVKQQNEDETIGVNTLIFTSLEEIVDFNAVGPNTMYVAEIGAEKARYAFSQRKSFYRQAALYHYVGTALYPALSTQVIDDVAQFNATQPIVSNSLPLWLALASYSFPGTLTCPLPLYPSFLVEDNLVPPYGSVHILPDSTTALQGAPSLGRNLSHHQLMHDRVKITLYGLRNINAMDFVDCVNAYSVNTDMLGMMNMPAMRDEKRTQVEMGIIAQKKVIEYDVSYYQSTVRAVTRQLITSAVPTFIVNSL